MAQSRSTAPRISAQKLSNSVQRKKTKCEVNSGDHNDCGLALLSHPAPDVITPGALVRVVLLASKNGTKKRPRRAFNY